MASVIQSDLIASSPPIPQHEYQQAQRAFESSISPTLSGNASVMSDGHSIASTLSASYPPYIHNVSPMPEYISQASASQVATDSSRAQLNSASEESTAGADPNGRIAVSEGAVYAVNTFLDKLLHDVFLLARSTRLANVKPAVADILRKSLARDAIAQAEQNLQDLLDLEDEEEDEEDGETTGLSDGRPRTSQAHNGFAGWNLEHAWKRARLRVMMRSERCEFDIEDDQRFAQQEALVSPSQHSSHDASFISLSSEIFLAGVLDYLSEQLFALAGPPAAGRMRRGSKRSNPGTQPQQHCIIEEQDVERGVLNSPIDRLWRGWRKSMRAAGFSLSGSPRHGRSVSMASTPVSPATTWRAGQPWGESNFQSSNEEVQTPRNIPGAFLETPAVETANREFIPDMAEHEYPEHVMASNIALPMGERDIDEIEVPGLAKDPEAEEEWAEVDAPRRKSHYIQTLRGQNFPESDTTTSKPRMTRQRSNSLPSPELRRYVPQTSYMDANKVPEEPDTAPVANGAEDAVPASTENSSAPVSANTSGMNGPPTSDANDISQQDTTASNDGNATIRESGHHLSTRPHVVDQALPRNTNPQDMAPDAVVDESLPAHTPVTLMTEGEARANAQKPHTIPSGAAIVGAAAGGTAAIAAAAAMQNSKSPFDDVTFTADSNALSPVQTPPPAASASVPNAGDESNQTSPANKARNREAAIGLGHTNGISLPEATAAVPAPVHIHNQDETGPRHLKTESPRTGNASTWGSSPEQQDQLRAFSANDDAEDSDVLTTPREFMERRKLATTRSPGPAGSAYLQPAQPPARVASKVSTTGLDGATTSASPVSPITPPETINKQLEQPATRSLISERFGSRRSPSTSPKQTQEEFNRPRATSRASSFKDPSSDATTAMPRRESSLRRFAVERHGSLVSLVDENTHKVRPKAPLTSSSITTAEDFDSLISGGETIKMTLSPSTVRDAPSPQGSRTSSIDHGMKSKFDTSREDVSKGSLPRRPPLETVPSTDSSSSPQLGKSDKRGRQGSQDTQKSRQSFSRPAVRNKSKTRAGFTAREPVVQTDSTRDFADFIRSTGPDREPQTLVPALTNKGRNASVSSKSGDFGGLRKLSFGGRSAHKADMSSGNAPQLPQVSQNAGIKIKSNLQAREASGNQPGMSALIDVIRTGPNEGPGKQQKGVTKDIAPFRFSMESDELRGLTDPTRTDFSNGLTPTASHADLAAPRDGRGSVSTMATMATYNSRAPLMQQNGSSNGISGTTQPAYGSSAPRLSQPVKNKPAKADEGDGKKRYRNKDPYAIDFSDDDEFEDEEGDVTALPRQGSTASGTGYGRQNSASEARQVQSSGPPASGLALNGVSYNPSPLGTSSNPTSTPAYAASQSTDSPPQMRPAQIRSQISSGSVPTTTSGSGTGSVPRNPNRPRMELKDVGAAPRSTRLNAIHTTATGDLADFLKNSGPPSPVRKNFDGGAPAPNIGSGGGGNGKVKGAKEEKKGGKFWQRKNRYLDMP